MGFLQWAIHNWFTLLQSVGIIGSLLFTAASLRLDAKARQVGNLMAITKNHREIWGELYERPELARVIDAGVDLEHAPMTREEALLIRFVILHLNSVYHALREGVLLKMEGLHKDIRWFFSLPMPKTVWKAMKPLQDADFARFVESARTEK